MNIYIDSMTDVITNSSWITFARMKEEHIPSVKKLYQKILDALDIKEKVDDLFDFIIAIQEETAMEYCRVHFGMKDKDYPKYNAFAEDISKEKIRYQKELYAFMKQNNISFQEITNNKEFRVQDMTTVFVVSKKNNKVIDMGDMLRNMCETFEANNYTYDQYTGEHVSEL